MKTNWSKHWKASSQPRKQRKYRCNAPLHVKHKFMRTHLSKELIKKYNTRNIILRKGDKVKIVRGQFKSKIGLVSKVDLKKGVVFIEGAERTKKNGAKVPCPIHPSNLIILSLELGDKKRGKILNRTKGA